MRSHKTGQQRKVLKEKKFLNGGIFQTLFTKFKKLNIEKVNMGDSAILTLETKNGGKFCVWAPKRLTEDLMEDDSYQFVYKIGLKTSADGNEYFDYELM